MRHLKRHRPLALLLAAAVTVTTAQAQDSADTAARALPNYRVEVVVFRHLNPSLYGDERMQPLATPAFSDSNPDGSDEPLVVAGDTAAFSPVDEVDSTPAVAWGEFDQVPADARKLNNVYAWMRTASNYSPLLHAGWVQPGYPRSEAVPVALSGASRGWWFEGSVTLSLERFLRLSFDLELAGEDEPTVYHLEQGRKMRSRTVHYIDHPRFGVIATIYPES
ncbi:MAG: CsiV family protein [Pseudomonadota bacterium]